MAEAALIDTRTGVETPEGVWLALNPAGPVVRILAYAVDIGLRLLLWLAAAAALASLGRLGTGVMAIIAFLLEWFYPVAFEVLGSGATPGKRLFGLRVVRDDGAPVDARASVVRNLLRVVDFLPLGYATGLISMAVSRRFQRLGDFAAGTLVVYDEPAERAVAPALEGVRPPPLPLHPLEREAVLAFAERRTTLSPDRRRELAGILAPWLVGAGERSEDSVVEESVVKEAVVKGAGLERSGLEGLGHSDTAPAEPDGDDAAARDEDARNGAARDEKGRDEKARDEAVRELERIANGLLGER